VNDHWSPPASEPSYRDEPRETAAPASDPESPPPSSDERSSG
jgi:hypothetical protein